MCHSDIKASLCAFPFPAESQASSSSLATGGSPPLSPLSFLLVFMPWSAWRGGSSCCEAAPTSTDWPSEQRTCGCWEAWKSHGCCVGSVSACLDGQTTPGKGLCRKQESNRKHHTPVFIRSQNESVPPLVPRLSGINVKDSWLLSSACQHEPTWRKH